MQPQIRDTIDVAPEVWDDPVRGDVSFRVLFSADRTPTSSLYTGLTELPPAGWLGRHRHAQAEAIKRFQVLGTDFTEDNGMLTPSLKLKRSVVLKEFDAEVEALYSR